MKTNGFTLIELLVVVLIIGILSAVALPQYNRAVLKARYSELQTIISAYKTVAETYYMANGSYPDYWTDMDLEPPAGCTADNNISGMLRCSSKSFAVDLYNNNNKNFVGFYQPNNKMKAAYVQWLDVSDKPAQRECWAVTGDADARALCKSLNGTEAGAATHPSCTSVGGCTIYILP